MPQAAEERAEAAARARAERERAAEERRAAAEAAAEERRQAAAKAQQERERAAAAGGCTKQRCQRSGLGCSMRMDEWWLFVEMLSGYMYMAATVDSPHTACTLAVLCMQ